MNDVIGNKQRVYLFDKNATLAIIMVLLCIFLNTARGFEVFDATYYRGKPDLEVYGIKPINVIYAGQFWEKHEDLERPPTMQRLVNLAQEAARRSEVTVLDIEHWRISQASDNVINSNIVKYLGVLEEFKKYTPNVKIGYYGFPPIRDYWRAIKGDQRGGYQVWMAENMKLKPIADQVDILFPSVYTFYADQNGWRKYAIAQIHEAYRVGGGKPVIVFLWPRFHNSNKLLKGTFLSADYWRLQLETARQYADGLVIWDGSKEKWREDFPWWGVTKDFMQTIRN